MSEHARTRWLRLAAPGVVVLSSWLVLLLAIYCGQSGGAATASEPPAKHPKLATVLSDLARATPQQRGPLRRPELLAGLKGIALASMPKSVGDALHGRLLRIDENAQVQVYFEVTSVTGEVLRQLGAAGAAVELQDRGERLIQARVPVTRLEEVAALLFVRFVRLPDYGVHLTGSVDTEGDSILKAQEVRSMFHVDGSGVRVGVLSDGLKGVFAQNCTTCGGVAGGPISTGDLPEATGTRNSAGVLTASSAGITGRSFSANRDLEGLPPPGCGFAGAGAEGTALLEIVHDLAPGAQLSFANFDTSLAFKQAVNYLAANADAVVDDIAFFGLPYDGTSDVSRNTADALNGATHPIRAYFTAVGNAAQEHYQGDFLDSGVDGAARVGAAGDLHLFQAATWTSDVLGIGPSVTDKIMLPSQAEVIVVLTWNDPFGSSNNDYELFLVRESTGSVVARSANPQTGSQDPVETLDYVNDTGAEGLFDILIQNARNSAAIRNLNMFLFTPECAQAAIAPLAPPGHERHNYNTPAGSVAAESDAGGSPASVISVGAIRASDPGNVDIEFFSSNGPTADGRLKPEVTGIDGVAVTGAGDFVNPFFGTSAAAPHAAGVAALLLQLAPCLRDAAPGAVDNVTARSTLRDLVLNNAVPLGSPAPNDVFGYGRIDALAAALKTLPAGTASDQIVSGNTPTGASVSLAGFTDPDHCPLAFAATGACTSASPPSSSIDCPFGTNTATVTATNNGVTYSAPETAKITVTNFSLSVSPPSVTLSAGQRAQHTVSVTPHNGPFSNPISMACANLPPRASCSFSPATLTPGSTAVTSQLTIFTAASGSSPPGHGPQNGSPIGELGLALSGLAVTAFILTGARGKNNRLSLAFALGAIVLPLMAYLACGGGAAVAPPSPGTPPGTYNVTISGTSGSLVESTSVSLSVNSS